jgi:hypothetical protein
MRREQALIAKLRATENEIKAELRRFNVIHRRGFDGPISAQLRIISDTVAVSIHYSKKKAQIKDEHKGYFVWAASLCVARIQISFLRGEPPIAMRGCISYGEHAVVNNFIIGPAVDLAAEYHEQAEGALVWLLPSAEAKYQSTVLLPRDLLLLYDVPLKYGARLRTPVVNPLYFATSADQRRKIIDAHAKAMSGVERLDVWLKRQNTIEFLEMADISSAELEQGQVEPWPTMAVRKPAISPRPAKSK